MEMEDLVDEELRDYHNKLSEESLDYLFDDALEELMVR